MKEGKIREKGEKRKAILLGSIVGKNKLGKKEVVCTGKREVNRQDQNHKIRLKMVKVICICLLPGIRLFYGARKGRRRKPLALKLFLSF